ncbi:MAG: hypothetical protein ABUT20_12385 [Bacteroidota bacterium]
MVNDLLIEYFFGRAIEYQLSFRCVALLYYITAMCHELRDNSSETFIILAAHGSQFEACSADPIAIGLQNVQVSAQAEQTIDSPDSYRDTKAGYTKVLYIKAIHT